MLHPAVALVVCLASVLTVAMLLHRLDAAAHRYKPLDPFIDGLPAAVTTVHFLTMLACTGRPWVSLALVSGGAVLLCVVNRLKYRLFREPIVFLDATLCMQVVRHPGFYVPYLFPAPVLAGGAVVAVALGWMWMQEPALAAGWRWAAGVGVGLGLAGGLWLASLLLPSRRTAAIALLERHAPSLDANEDLARFGLLASLALHGLWHAHLRGRDGRPGIPEFAQPSAAAGGSPLPDRPETLPHLVLVQAESFFDVRRHCPDAPGSLLANLDRLRGHAHGTGGQFLVQTHGAYTMRTEFSVLTGLPLERLGTDAYNPYFTTSQRPVWSLAWELRQAGYQTVCIHPFYLSFFRRNRVLPHLGFQELQGLEAFADAPRCGPYVSDAAVAEAVLRRLSRSAEPTFVFVISMEAHGPWKPGRLGHAGTPMDIYLQHLQHTDAMFGQLADGLTALDRPAVLCGYGDHVGCLPEATAGHQDAAAVVPTDWLAWSSDDRPLPAPGPRRPDELGRLLRNAAGLSS